MTTIQLLMIVSNGADTILNTLESYKGQVDRYFICINNCTDETPKIVKNFKRTCPVPVIIKFIEFNGFSNTRNRALILSYDLKYTWTLFIDDSYEYRGSSLHRELSKYDLDPNVHCITIKVSRNHMSYYSKRILRTVSKLFFIGKIHETVACNAHAQLHNSYIEDIGTAKQLKRTQDRIEYDISQLEGLDDTRSAYYRAGYYTQLYMLGRCSIEEPINHYKKRISMKCTDKEETFLSCIHLGHLYKSNKDETNAIRTYLQATLIYPDRAGEAYYLIYLTTGNTFYIKKAYENRYHGKSILPIDDFIYSNNGKGLIEKNYLDYQNYPFPQNTSS